MRRLAVALLLLLGLWLRASGLSHDYAEGSSYHPDTAKQVRAAERFINGVYYVRTGNRDIDGYPYLNSHLVEGLWRLYDLGARTTLGVIGIRQPVGNPHPLTLAWMTLALNVTLSSLLILAVFRMGEETFGTATGVLAAAFLAVSPIDVVACHFANSDTTAAFFATLAVWMALRLHRSGRLLHAVAATFLATAGFAAKYHAGMAIVPVALAHILHEGGLRAVVSRRALARLAAIAATGVVAIFVTIPAMFLHPLVVPVDVVDFFGHVSSSRRVPFLEGAGFFARFSYSMERNLPILWEGLGAGFSLLAVAAVLGCLVRPCPRRAILVAMPLLYFLVGVSLRPTAPAVYHTLMTPLLFVLGAELLVRTWRVRGTSAVRAGVAAIALFALGGELRKSLEQRFFFLRDDTRAMARRWVLENVPASFEVGKHAYAFDLDRRLSAPEGRLLPSTNIRPIPPPPGATTLRSFRVEDRSLPVFRNPVIDLFLETPLLRDGWRIPPLPRAPSVSANDFLFDDGPVFVRSEKRIGLDPENDVDRILVTRSPLEPVLVRVRAGALATHVRLSVAGPSRDLSLGARESLRLELDRLEESFPSRGDNRFHRITAASGPGEAEIELATTPAEKALLLWYDGAFAEAHPWLVRAAAEDEPRFAAMALIARGLGGVEAEEPALARLEAAAARLSADRETVNARDGGALDYLDRLPYVAAEADEADTRGFAVAIDREASNGRVVRPAPLDMPRSRRIVVPTPMLEAAPYHVGIRLRCLEGGSGRIRAIVETPPLRRLTGAARLECRGAGPLEEIRLPMTVSRPIPSGHLRVTLPGKPSVAVDRVDLRPDVAAAEALLIRLLRLVRENDVAAVAGEKLAYDLLLAWGDRLAARAAVSGALDAYRAAARLRPDAARPLLAIEAISPRASEEEKARLTEELRLAKLAGAHALRRVDARFEYDLALDGFRLDATTVAAGGELGLALAWRLLALDAPTTATIASVHFLDDAGRLVFTGDRPLADHLTVESAPDAIAPTLPMIAIPRDVPPGRYRIRIGLVAGEGGRRHRVVSSALERDGRAVILPQPIMILPRPDGAASW